ncbi:MAG TPA: hypothetical protein VF077_13255 [Nitrospiraceae bacterium]
MENGKNDIEDVLEAADRELEACTEANRRTGHIILRVWRVWVRREWAPHVAAEQEDKIRMRAYMNSLRWALAALCTIGGLVAWLLHQMVELAQLLRVGMGGP